MSNSFKFQMRAVGLAWKNSAEELTDRRQGVRCWQVNLFHNPISIGVSKSQAREVHGPSAFFFAPLMSQWYMGLGAGFSDDWCSCDGDIEAALKHHGLSSGEAIPVNNVSELERCFRSMHREWKERPLFANEALRDLMMEFMRLCARGRLRHVAEEQHYSQILEVRQQLRTQFQRSWSVTEMSEIVGLSENRFSYLYRRYCGESPQRDLIAFRMQRAMELMVNQKELSIMDIGELCGYADSMYFSRVFKGFFGRPPSAYRE